MLGAERLTDVPRSSNGFGGLSGAWGSSNLWLKRTLEGGATMWRVIYALMIRESRTRYGKSDIGYLWALLEPLIQLLILWWVFTVLASRVVPLSASMPVFLVTGILPYNFWRSCVARGATAATANVPLLTYPQVKVMDVVLARVLLDGATLVVVTLIFVVGLKFFAGEPFSSWIDHPLSGMMSLFALFYMTIGSAVFSCSLGRIWPAWSDFFGYLGRPLWFISGIFFTLESLPPGGRTYALYNPLAHMIEWLRSAWIPGFESSHYSVIYVLSFSTALLFIGLFINWILGVAGFADEQA